MKALALVSIRLYQMTLSQILPSACRFFWLPPGPYYLAVVPENTRGRSVVSVQPPPGTGGHREDVITPVIYPRIAPNGDPSPVSVRAAGCNAECTVMRSCAARATAYPDSQLDDLLIL